MLPTSSWGRPTSLTRSFCGITNRIVLSPSESEQIVLSTSPAERVQTPCFGRPGSFGNQGRPLHALRSTALIRACA